MENQGITQQNAILILISTKISLEDKAPEGIDGIILDIFSI